MMRLALVPLLCILSTACAKNDEPQEEYQVVSHQVSTGEWVFVRVNSAEHTRVRLTAVCVSHAIGDRRADDNCELRVGSTLVRKLLPKDPSPESLARMETDFVNVYQRGDLLFVDQGLGPDRVFQTLLVKSSDVLTKQETPF